MSCTKCELHTQANAVCVPGNGDELPHILFISGAPGYTEDTSGRGYRGKAGLIVKRIVAQELGDIKARFTYAVRCFPNTHGKSEKPKAKHVKACGPYLMEEIRKTRPMMLVPLGRVACNALKITGSMDKIAGIPMKLDVAGKEYTCVPMLEPGHIMARPALRSVWESHWHTVRSVCAGHQTDLLSLVNGEIVDEKQVISPLYEECPVGLDLETSGLKPTQGSILSVACASPTRAYAAQIRTPIGLRSLRAALLTRNPDRPIIVHGSRFEERWFRDFLGVKLPEGTLIDTMLLSQRAQPGQPAGLGPLTARLMPELSGFKSETQAMLDAGHAVSVDVRDLLVRNLIDAAVLLPLYEKLTEIWADRLAHHNG